MKILNVLLGLIMALTFITTFTQDEVFCQSQSVATVINIRVVDSSQTAKTGEDPNMVLARGIPLFGDNMTGEMKDERTDGGIRPSYTVYEKL